MSEDAVPPQETSEPTADRLARDLLGEIRAGRPPAPVLGSLLRHAFRGCPPIDDNVVAASEWFGRSDEDRGRALVDLLLLADAVGGPVRRGDLTFPPLGTPAPEP